MTGATAADRWAVGADGVPIWHSQAVAIADAALTLATEAARLAAECATVAATAGKQIETVKILIEAHQPVDGAS